MSTLPGLRFYAFLYQDESGAETDDGLSLLRLEAVEADWFDPVWEEMRPGGGEALESLLPRVAGSAFAAEFTWLSADLRRTLYDVHDRYSRRTTDPHDPARVALLEVLVDDTILPGREIREGNWYQVSLGPGEPLLDLRNPEEAREAIVSRLSVPPAPDPPPTLHRIDGMRPLDRSEGTAIAPVFAALHFPQAPPREDGGWPSHLAAVKIYPEGGVGLVGCDGAEGPDGPHSGQGAGEGEEGGLFDQDEFAHCHKGLCACRHRRLDDLIPLWRRRRRAAVWHQGTGGTPWTVAQPSPPGVGGSAQGGGVFGMQGVVIEEQTRTAPAPADAPPAYQAFVGVNLVGAGNNVAVWNAEGRLEAYVDYGWPTSTNQNTYPPGAADPCVCGDPLMVLTHWDYDHYAMARRVPEALWCRWIAPRQVYGPVAKRDLYQPLRRSGGKGGRLYLWEEAGGSLAVPFGVVVRATGKPANDDCLVVYVRADGPPAVPVPRQVARASREPGVAIGGISGEWLPPGMPSPFDGGDVHVVIPAAGAGHFAPPQWPATAGEWRTLGNGLPARWIPPVGVRTQLGTKFIPPGGMGGWAVSAECFVRSGGIVIDFPPAWTGHDGSIAISPTPGTAWEHALGGSVGEIPADGLEHGGSRWVPVWGSGLGACNEIQRPDAAETLLVRNGPAPFEGGARYVLLPGDAGFEHFPALPSASSSGGPPARVVGLLAAHHGSATWISGAAATAALQVACIPDPAGGPEHAPAPIVYSYGTRLEGANARKHCYTRGKTEGHPHKRALAAYRGRGWEAAEDDDVSVGQPFARLNTAPEDYRSLHPYNPLGIDGALHGPDAARIQGHRNGNVALGWDAQAGRTLQGDQVPVGTPGPQPHGPGVRPPLRRVCTICNKERDYYF